MIEQDFICSDSFESSGIVEWNSPSNIALVKYWVKKQKKVIIRRNTHLLEVMKI